MFLAIFGMVFTFITVITSVLIGAYVMHCKQTTKNPLPKVFDTVPDYEVTKDIPPPGFYE